MDGIGKEAESKTREDHASRLREGQCLNVAQN
jgi:hypothetical protein